MSGVMLRYDGIGIGSNNSFSVSSVSDKESFSKVNEILNREAAYQNYGNPCDLYSVSLDGSVSALPENTENISVGLWSASQTDENGVFLPPVAVSMVSDEYFTTAGVTLKFDTNKGIYANNLLIEWYRDNTKIIEKTFTPDNAEFFCANRVELFNRVDITFYSLNAPKNRLRLQSVEFGIVTEFTAKDLKNSAIKQSISPICTEMPISTLNFSVVARNNIDYVFQEKQPIDAYFNEELKGSFFIKKATQKSNSVYNVLCEDYVGILENEIFSGDYYSYVDAGIVIRRICSKANVPVIIPADIEKKVLKGYLPRSTCRKALQQVLFALQAYADTTNSNVLNIKRLPAKQQTIPRNRVMQGINILEAEKISEVQIAMHSYVKLDDEVVLYDAKESGSGENIEIIFNEPYHRLSVEYGNFVESSANHAIINATERTRLKGRKFLHTTVIKSKKNEFFPSGAKKNVLRIENATLVNADNIDIILDKCYNHFVKNKSASARIVEGKHESDSGYIYDSTISLGDELTVQTPFMGDFVGNLESQSFIMNGGILVKDCVIK